MTLFYPFFYIPFTLSFSDCIIQTPHKQKKKKIKLSGSFYIFRRKFFIQRKAQLYNFWERKRTFYYIDTCLTHNRFYIYQQKRDDGKKKIVPHVPKENQYNVCYFWIINSIILLNYILFNSIITDGYIYMKINKINWNQSTLFFFW